MGIIYGKEQCEVGEAGLRGTRTPVEARDETDKQIQAIIDAEIENAKCQLTEEMLRDVGIGHEVDALIRMNPNVQDLKGLESNMDCIRKIKSYIETLKGNYPNDEYLRKIDANAIARENNYSWIRSLIAIGDNVDWLRGRETKSEFSNGPNEYGDMRDKQAEENKGFAQRTMKDSEFVTLRMMD